MRNPITPVSTDEARQAERAASVLDRTPGPVTFGYTKPNGEHSTRTGTLVTFLGTEGYSNHSARLDTPDGERTFSLRAMDGVRPA